MSSKPNWSESVSSAFVLWSQGNGVFLLERPQKNNSVGKVADRWRTWECHSPYLFLLYICHNTTGHSQYFKHSGYLFSTHNFIHFFYVRKFTIPAALRQIGDVSSESEEEEGGGSEEVCIFLLFYQTFNVKIKNPRKRPHHSTDICVHG